jgi:hypothetical protein
LALLIEKIGIVQFLYLLVDFLDRLIFQNITTSSIDLKSNYKQISINPMNTSANIIVDIPSKFQENNDENNDENENNDIHNNQIKDISKRKLVKYIISTIITILSICFIIVSIWTGASTFPTGVILQFALLFIALVIIFYCEGLKIAIVSTIEDIPTITNTRKMFVYYNNIHIFKYFILIINLYFILGVKFHIFINY